MHPRERGCSIKLLHYDNNKNEVTVQVVNFDRHKIKKPAQSGLERLKGGNKKH